MLRGDAAWSLTVMFLTMWDYLEEAGGAVALLEKDCSGQRLFQTACAILRDEAKRTQMEQTMAELGIRDAADRIYQTILEICR